MCGIAGGFGFEIPNAEIAVVLRRMNDAMVHRGPDEEGYWTAPKLRAGLAVRRLSVIDLATGHQPLVNEDGSIALACNGEIYNYKRLRNELKSRGHCFRSQSDCEVVLHLYEDHGVECLKFLNGMFGLAILDCRQKRLLLARDPIGMKPLYYTRTPNGFLFASEAKALLASCLISAEPDWEGLDIFLTVGYIPAPKTCFRGVERMRAGEFLVLEGGSERREKFWNVRFDNSLRVRSEREYAEELEQRLQQAVESHLVADVPVGAYLSGGWDSSLTARFAARFSSGRLKTFSIVFPDEPEESEANYSRLMAAHIGSEHHEIEFRSSSVPQMMSEIVEAVEEPSVSSPSPVLFQLSAFAAKQVKVAVSGEGSDELFGGYPWLRGAWMYRLRTVLPKFLVRPLANRVLHPRWGRLWRILAAESEQSADLEWLRSLTPAHKRRFMKADLPLLGNDGIQATSPPPQTLTSCADRQQQRLSIDLTRRLPEGLLFINDKTSMAHSLELRMPFLDRNVLEFALSLPSSMKMRGAQEKYIVSKLLHNLPKELVSRRKYGLHFPMWAPPSQPFAAFLRETLLDSSRIPLFERRPLEAWLKHALVGKRRGIGAVWTLAFLAIWWDHFISRSWSPSVS
jgi:asparagine synthase (glutamine-hydrolysing)